MSRPIRILALVTDAFGCRGGIAQYNRDFIQALAACPGVETIDILPRICVAEIVGLPRCARQRRPIRNQVAYSIRAVGVALARRPDIIFCGHLYMAPLGALVARLVGAKLVVQSHGREVWPRPNAVRRAGLEAADLALCGSRNTRARLIDWASIAPERVLVLPNTVSELFSPADASGVRAELGLQDKSVLLSVSRLDANERYKGQDRVIRLLNRLRDRGHDVVYLVGGHGDDRGRLEALARDEGVAEQVRFLGQVPIAQLPNLYRAADVYVMPSTGEGFGIVYLEAMACGTPALGLAAGGAPDALVDGTAVDEAELEHALVRCLASPKPDPAVLAAKVRARFGRAVFQERLARIVGRLAAMEAGATA